MPKVKKRKNRSKKESIEDRITPIDKIRGGISALIYGRSGTGKTTLSSSFPTPMLLLDVGERGTDSIADVSGIEVIKINDWEDFEEVYRYIDDNHKKYKTVVIDALHTLQD